MDVIASILCRLPVKSLCRFRCVSKSWKSLISEPRFVKTHQKTLNRTHLIFTYKGLSYTVPFSNNETVSTLMKHLPELSEYIFIGSANGLVIASSYDFHMHTPSFVVLNFMTKDSVELPNSIEKHIRGNEDAAGFGYDSVTDDYKVVFIFHTESSLTYPSYLSYVYVYSLRTCTWRRVSDSPYNHSLISWDRRGVFVNGFVHWIAKKGSDSVIVAFSLADETFSEVPPPSQCNNGYGLSCYTCRLVALGDKLAIVTEGGLVWLMNEYGLEKSWTKIVVHGYNGTTMIKPENLFATHDLTRICYLEEGSFPKSGDISNMNLGKLKSSFVESLVSPKLDTAN